jgi:predicted nucleic acid-binding protein
MPFEVATAFRRMQLSKLIDSAGATAAHNDLLGLGVDLWPHRRLAERAWELRDTITYGDACYVAPPNCSAPRSSPSTVG